MCGVCTLVLYCICALHLIWSGKFIATAHLRQYVLKLLYYIRGLYESCRFGDIFSLRVRSRKTRVHIRNEFLRVGEIRCLDQHRFGSDGSKLGQVKRYKPLVSALSY